MVVVVEKMEEELVVVEEVLEEVLEEVVEALSLVIRLYHHHHHTRFVYHTFVESAVYNVIQCLLMLTREYKSQ